MYKLIAVPDKQTKREMTRGGDLSLQVTDLSVISLLIQGTETISMIGIIKGGVNTQTLILCKQICLKLTNGSVTAVQLITFVVLCTGTLTTTPMLLL